MLKGVTSFSVQVGSTVFPSASKMVLLSGGVKLERLKVTVITLSGAHQ